MQILPVHVPIIIIMVIEDVLMNSNKSLVDVFKQLIFAVPEILCIQMSGVRFSNINPNDWYISVMILAAAIIFPMSIKFGRMFRGIVAPIIAFFILGYMYQSSGSVLPSATLMMGGLFMKGYLRGISEMCLGVFAWEIVEYLNGKELKYYQIIIVRFVEIFIFASVCVVAMVGKRQEWYFILLIGIVIGIVLSFSKYSFFKLLPKSKIITYLGGISLVIFLSQRIVLEMLVYIKIDSYWPNLIIYTVGTIVFSALLDYVVKHLRRI